jgi:hypothetical protein
MPIISLTSEIVRLENVDGQCVHDIETAKKVASMSKIVLASSSETWLVSCPGPTFNHFYNSDMEGLGMDKVQEIFHNSYHEMRASSIVSNRTNETVDDQLLVSEHAESFPITRSSRNSNREDVDSSNIYINPSGRIDHFRQKTH